MLIRFFARNYRTFKDGFVFSMEPDPELRELDYSILSERVGERACRGLSSAVIYGPNASGKTSIIRALDTMRSIVLRGNIRDTNEDALLKEGAGTLSLIPFSGAPAEPVELGAVFTHRGLLIEYSFRMDLGEFMQSGCSRRIVSESLSVNDREDLLPQGREPFPGRARKRKRLPE